MAAVSQGAAEAGGEVLGVTSDQIEAFRPLGPNEWVTREIRFQSLRERLTYLVVENDGIIVLPGGIGTLSEMALAWSFLQVGEMPARPIALLGELWRETVTAFVDPQYVRPEHFSLLQFATEPREAVAFVSASGPVLYE
jgi:predicted Rossmann-fold nucleotide-binding protein